MIKQFTCQSAILGIIIGAVFTVISIHIIPEFNLVTDYLSALGVNGTGAIVFNIGTIISAIMVLPIFAKINDFLGNSISSRIGMVLGIVSCIGIIGVAIFPMGMAIHTGAAALFFATMGFAILFFGIEIFPKNNTLGIFSLLVVFIDVFMLANPFAAFVEKIAVSMILLWIALLAVYMMRE